LKYTSDGQDNTLDIRWSLFTRNTIWWAVKLDDDYYLLPWWVKTDDYELAKEYDLNYVRRVSLCAEDDYAVKITYDSRIQTNPPKGFSR
jgi:hypothetical protein